MTKHTLLLIGGDLCERVAARLDASAWRCVGMRRRAMPETAQGLRWIRADLGHREELAAALADVRGITHILYAPAPGERTSEAYATAYPLGLAALLEALPDPGQLRRCVLVDSTAVWGPSEDWVDEDTPTNPEDFRGTRMLEAESTLREHLPSPRFPQARATALRLSGLYGPGRLRLIEGLRAGRISAPDGPGHWANRIHVDDAARACIHLLTLADPLSCYVGTDDRPRPTAELYDGLARLIDAPAPTRVPGPPDGKRLSNRRLRASGWTPQWPDALAGYVARLQAKDSA
ncbi:Nucleoside-diphosphate-sugar epimerase OS=Castellaniella defragrans OX=75697 GN=HNR28_001314 PE=4 SV=1 [Castellaniella defragrans]